MFEVQPIHRLHQRLLQLFIKLCSIHHQLQMKISNIGNSLLTCSNHQFQLFNGVPLGRGVGAGGMGAMLGGHPRQGVGGRMLQGIAPHLQDVRGAYLLPC